MFNLSVAFGSGSGIIVWGFMFKTKEKADEALKQLEAGNVGRIQINDDFGQSGRIGGEHIQGVMLEDMSQTKLAHIERNLHEMRTKAGIMSAAGADPGLKFAMQNQGPPVLGAGPNGRF